MFWLHGANAIRISGSEEDSTFMESSAAFFVWPLRTRMKIKPVRESEL